MTNKGFVSGPDDNIPIIVKQKVRPPKKGKVKRRVPPGVIDIPNSELKAIQPPLSFEEYKKSPEFNNANLYIIATGGSARDLDIGKLVRDNNGEKEKAYTLCLNRSFLYLMKDHNLIPSFNVTYDPHEFVESVKIIRKPKYENLIPKLKKVNFILPERGYSCDLYYGKPERRRLQKYAKKMVQWLGNKGRMILFPKTLPLNTSKWTDTIPRYTPGVENKLTHVALPIAYKLGFKKIYLIGTDYNHHTGHWYRGEKDKADFKFKAKTANLYTNKPNGPKPERRHTLTMNRQCLSFWKTQFEKQGGYIKSFVPADLTPMSDIIESIKVKKDYIK